MSHSLGREFIDKKRLARLVCARWAAEGWRDFPVLRFDLQRHQGWLLYLYLALVCCYSNLLSKVKGSLLADQATLQELVDLVAEKKIKVATKSYKLDQVNEVVEAAQKVRRSVTSHWAVCSLPHI